VIPSFWRQFQTSWNYRFEDTYISIFQTWDWDEIIYHGIKDWERLAEINYERYGLHSMSDLETFPDPESREYYQRYLSFKLRRGNNYGLTKGQASPTSDLGFVTKTTPLGATQPLNPLALALASDVSFLSRGFAADIEHLPELLRMGIEHRGFSLIDILQPCVSFNHKNTFQWYQERIYKLEEENYDPADKMAALAKAQEWGDRIPIGLIYRNERPVYEEQLPDLKEMPLVKQKIDPLQFEALIDEFE